jgi:hypothetical protein
VCQDADGDGRYHAPYTSGYDAIAEIAGTGPVFRNQVVPLGGPLDSWHPATRAEDNAGAAAACVEA